MEKEPKEPDELNTEHSETNTDREDNQTKPNTNTDREDNQTKPNTNIHRPMCRTELL